MGDESAHALAVTQHVGGRCPFVYVLELEFYAEGVAEQDGCA
jgi:hypothetical protein